MTPWRLGRRALLGGTAASVVAGAGCGRPPPPPEVRLVGQSPERGHAIRDGTARAQAGTAAERLTTKVAIVGAGAAGAAAAWRLARVGLRDIVLLELEPAPGGTARHGETARSAYPMGAHYLPSPHPENRGLQALLEDLGVIIARDRNGRPEYDPLVVCAGPVERHRDRGLWNEGLYPAAGQTAEEEAQWARWQAHLEALDVRRGADGRRLFELPVAKSSEELRHLDRLSMADYLDRLGFTSSRLRWLVDYSCRDDYGCTLEQTSAFAALHHDLCRGLEGRHERVILTWPEGNDHLVAAMLEGAAAGDRLRLDHAVVSIDPDDGRVLAWDMASERAIEIRAEVVLWAAPRFVLGRVLPRGRDPLPRGTLDYAPWLVANLELSRAPGGIGTPLAWDNVAVGADDLGYVVATHGEPLTESNRPGTVITYYEPRPAPDAAGLAAQRRWLLDTPAETFADHVVAHLEAMHPGIRPTIRRIDVARWGHGMIRPVPGRLFGGALDRAAAPIGRVLPCAADVGGLPLFEQAFAGGVAAAEDALSRLGHPVATLL